MHSLDGVERNIELIGKLFPNAITEVMRDGKVEHAIDFDVLRQELSDSIVEGWDERYQFAWPDKKQAMLAANVLDGRLLWLIIERKPRCHRCWQI